MIEPNEILGGGWKSLGEMPVASDPKAKRFMNYVRRNEAGNIELLSVREGQFDSLATIREFTEDGPRYRDMAEGETQVELLASYAIRSQEPRPFSETHSGSIADVAARFSVAGLKELEVRGAQK